MDEKEMRQTGYPCPLGAETGPQTIVVRQVIAEEEAQKVLDIHVEVPERKPAIEQIIDVFVKNVEINAVDIIRDKVIVRGEFEVKAVYVADLPDNPVHALEIKHYRWTQDIDMPGARRGMDADASVAVEFVDYEVSEYTRAYKYKYQDMSDDNDDQVCGTCGAVAEAEEMPDCSFGVKGAAVMPPPPPLPPPVCQCRQFDVSVVLKVTAKVLASREVQIGGFSGTTPTAPKG